MSPKLEIAPGIAVSVSIGVDWLMVSFGSPSVDRGAAAGSLQAASAAITTAERWRVRNGRSVVGRGSLNPSMASGRPGHRDSPRVWAIDGCTEVSGVPTARDAHDAVLAAGALGAAASR